MSVDITNAEYIELIENILTELRPDKPVRAEIVRVADKRSGRSSEKLAIALDIERGPQTQVLFNFRDVLGLGELPLRAFITSRLTSIGVHPDIARERATRVTDEVKSEPTAAEAAKLREMLVKRRQPAVAPAVKKAEAASQGGFFGTAEVTADNVPTAGEAQDILLGEEDFSVPKGKRGGA